MIVHFLRVCDGPASCKTGLASHGCITGQKDGSYLAELLLANVYVVHGLILRYSSLITDRIVQILKDPHAPNPKLTPCTTAT